MIREPKYGLVATGEQITNAATYTQRGIAASAKAKRGIKIRGCADAVYSSDYRVRITSDQGFETYEVCVKYEGDYAYHQTLTRTGRMELTDETGKTFALLEDAAE